MNVSDVNSTPIEYDFSDTQRVRIVVGSVLLYIGVFGNVVALGTLIRKWKADNRVYFFLAALCIADIIGIGVREGIDIGWTTTYIWTASEAACKICMFLYAFGNTLAHYFLVGFNVDSAVTVLTLKSSKILGILLIAVSLIAAICINAPKAFIFSVETNPVHKELVQCVSFSYFQDRRSEMVFNLVMLIAIFWFPLFLIILTSVPTMLTWLKTSGVELEEAKAKDNNEMRTMSLDLAMVITLDFVFLFCWTPLVVCTLVNMFGDGIYIREPLWLAAQYISACSSCINPIVYGVFGCLRQRIP